MRKREHDRWKKKRGRRKERGEKRGWEEGLKIARRGRMERKWKRAKGRG